MTDVQVERLEFRLVGNETLRSVFSSFSHLQEQRGIHMQIHAYICILHPTFPELFTNTKSVMNLSKQWRKKNGLVPIEVWRSDKRNEWATRKGKWEKQK